MNESTPRYSCVIDGCPGNHSSKRDFCSEYADPDLIPGDPQEYWARMEAWVRAKPQNVAEQKALANLLDAVEGVLQFDWIDNDEDAYQAIERLRVANEQLGVVQRLANNP